MVPKPLFRHFLKSIWRQPRLQDSLHYHVQPYRYDSAIPTLLDVDVSILENRRNLPGIKLDSTVYLGWLDNIINFAGELSDVREHRVADERIWYKNGSYGDLDALTLYCMVRHTKPKRLIEVGCGRSTRIIERAIARNTDEGFPCECTFIEPFPPEYLRKEPPNGKFIIEKVQTQTIGLFQKLEASDILFIDTSHIVKTQSDCCYELLEIIPSLKPGVIVHVHDIFTPYDYPAEWIFERQFPFNEQYALECLLSLSSHEVILPVNLLWQEQRPRMLELLPCASDIPGAFWFVTK